MSKEGYDRAFTAALIACASTMANLIPPSIMAVVYGATGNVSIGGLFLAGIVPGVVVGIGLMIYSHFFGPVASRSRAPRSANSPTRRAPPYCRLMIPVIIMGGILTGWFTPTEAGMVASVYILLVLVPLLARGHIRHLPRDFVYTGLLYSIPLALVAAASAFGWMLAYLRGPDIVSGWIELFAGTDGRIIMLLLVLVFIVDRRLHGRGAGDHYLHADRHQAQRTRQHQAAAYGRGAHHDAGVWVDHAAIRIVVTGGVEIRRRSLRPRDVASLPIYVVFFVTIGFTVLFPDIVLYLPKLLLPESVGCFKSPATMHYICPP